MDFNPSIIVPQTLIWIWMSIKRDEISPGFSSCFLFFLVRADLRGYPDIGAWCLCEWSSSATPSQDLFLYSSGELLMTLHSFFYILPRVCVWHPALWKKIDSVSWCEDTAQVTECLYKGLVNIYSCIKLPFKSMLKLSWCTLADWLPLILYMF